MKNLNTFLTEFSDGFQFNNRFACRIQTPVQLSNQVTNSERQAIDWLGKGILVESTNLPDRAFQEVEMTQYGLTEQVPYHSQFTTLACVLNTPLSTRSGGPDDVVPRVFHSWQNLIQDFKTGYDSTRDFTFSGTNSQNGYYGEVDLVVFDRQNRPTMQYHFERVYPRVVESTPVTWREESEFTRLSVGFTFSTWYPVPLNDTNAGWFTGLDFLSSRPLSNPFQQNQMGYPGNPARPGEFQNGRFIPPGTGVGGFLRGVAREIISDVTNGRIRIN